MPRIRTLSNCQALFVGPAPSTGYHFIDGSGGLNNNYSNLNGNNNLLKEIDRIISVSYQITNSRTEIKHLGKRGLVSRPQISPPQITVSFDYMMMGLKNEARLGFNVNYTQFQYPNSGVPFYSSKVCPISGFVTRSFNQPNIAPFWPLDYRDDRNIFITIDNNGNDIHNNYNLENFSSPDDLIRANPNSKDMYVVGFGNCRINSYKTEAAVNSFPKATVTYISENMQVVSGGSGQLIPAVNTKNFSGITGINFVIPQSTNEGGPSVLLPGDIKIDIFKNKKVYGNVSGILTGFFSGNVTCNIFSFNTITSNISGNVSGNFAGNISGTLNTGNVFIPFNQQLSTPIFCSAVLNKIATGGGFGTLFGNCSGRPNPVSISVSGFQGNLYSPFYNLEYGFVSGTGTVKGLRISGFVTGINSGLFSGSITGFKNIPVSDLMVDTTDLKIQSYTIDMTFNREPLPSLGYKLPIDRRINFPVYANLSFNVLVGDNMSGSIVNQLNNDDDYNIDIKLLNPLCSADFSEVTIPPAEATKNTAGQIAIKYEFHNAKFQSMSFQSNINQSKTAILNFSVEIDPDDLSHGLFMSGLLNINKVEDFLIDESGDYILLDNIGNLLTSDWPILY